MAVTCALRRPAKSRTSVVAGGSGPWWARPGTDSMYHAPRPISASGSTMRATIDPVQNIRIAAIEFVPTAIAALNGEGLVPTHPAH